MSAPASRTLVVERHARVGIVGDPDTATEAWIILHGYAMLARGILHWFRAAARPGRVLIAPEALSRFYTETRGVRTVAASWMTREERLDEIRDIRHYLDRVVADVVGVRERVEVHGFSQGVPAAARWLAGNHHVIDRLVCWGNIVPGDVEPAALLPTIREGRVHYVIGHRDTRMLPADVAADAARLEGLGVPVTLHEFDGGHRIDDGILSRLDAGR